MKQCTETESAIMHCRDWPWKCEMCGAYKEPTNADHIRSMTDEELAVFLEEIGYDSMEHRSTYWRNWLKQLYKEDT